MQTGRDEPFQSMLDQVRTIGGADVAHVAVLSFRALQLYRIAALQKDLVSIQLNLLQNKEEPSKISGKETDAMLQRYGTYLSNLLSPYHLASVYS